MEKTEWIWHNGEFVAWDEAKVHLLIHALHYGSGVFEGIRFYASEKGPVIFRLRDHLQRLLYSASAIKLKIPFQLEVVEKATTELVKRNHIDQGYIRHLGFYGYGKMGLNPEGASQELAIAVWPWGAYLPHEMVDIKVSDYIRIHPRSLITDAKVCGHYVNSIMASQEISGTKYHEALFLDFEGNIAEGPGENIFIVRNGELFTPATGSILPGLTRNTVIEIARTKKLSVAETTLTLSDVCTADEAFFTGTAAEVTPIKSVNENILGNGTTGPITKEIRETYLDIVNGRAKEFAHYLTYVNSD